MVVDVVAVVEEVEEAAVVVAVVAAVAVEMAAVVAPQCHAVVTIAEAADAVVDVVAVAAAKRVPCGRVPAQGEVRPPRIVARERQLRALQYLKTCLRATYLDPGAISCHSWPRQKVA